jgi:hypothetical protein
MPIEFPQPPERVAAEARPPRDVGAGERAVGGAPVPPQPIFTTGLADVLAADDVERSISGPKHWRVSTFESGGSPQVKEVPDDPGQRGTATGDDRFSPQIREALAIASQDPRVGEGRFEARLFRLPALSLMALWLHSATQSLFVPIGRPAGLEADRVYDEASFLSALRASAERTLGAYRDAENPDELGS